MKKSYNPFKMWGSYVGAVIPVLALLKMQGSLSAGMTTMNTPFSGYLFSGAIGFLIGWGINSLWRKFK